jgi:hypothetical protein
MTTGGMTAGVGTEPWDTERASERAAEALRYLGRSVLNVVYGDQEGGGGS